MNRDLIKKAILLILDDERSIFHSFERMRDQEQSSSKSFTTLSKNSCRQIKAKTANIHLTPLQ